MSAPLSLACVLATATLLLSKSSLRSVALSSVAFFVLCSAQVVLVMSVLGLVGHLSTVPVVALHVVTLVFAVVVLRAQRGRSLPIRESRRAAAPRIAAEVGRFPAWLKVFLFALGVAYAITLVLALIAPPSIQDAMTYYLGRVGFWLQQQSLAFFPTNNLRQTTFPPNASLVFAWTFLLSGGDSFVQLVQWCSALTSAIAVYVLTRQLGAARRPAVFCALLWASAPIVVLESSSAQIDLFTTALVTAACVFSVEYLRRGGVTRLALAALATGLAVGSKLTALIMLPGAAVVAVLLLVRGRLSGDRRPFRLVAASLVAVLCLGSFVYAQSWWVYGSAAAARRDYRSAPIELLRPLVINGVRNTYQLFDTSGLPGPLRRRAEELKYRVGGALFSDFGQTLLSGEYLMQDYAVFGRVFTPALTYVQFVHPDRVGMGLLGPILVLLLPAALILRRRWLDRRLVCALAALFVSFCVSLCVVAGYHYFHSRYSATAFALLAPLASLLYHERGWRRVVCVILSTLALLQCWNVLLVNENRPFLGPRPWWSYDRIGLATINHPENEGILRVLAETVAAKATIGVATGPSGWIFPFFGSALSRRVFNVAVDDQLEDAASLQRLGIQFLYVQRLRKAVLEDAERQPWLDLVWEDDLGVLFALTRDPPR